MADTDQEVDLIMQIMGDCLANGLTGRESWLVATSWIEGSVVVLRSCVLKLTAPVA